MKTLFVTSFHSYVSRNIHSTDFLVHLKAQRDVRVVMLVPQYKIAFFKECFEGGNVEVVGVKTGVSSRTKTGLFFKRFAELAYVSETNTVKRKYKFYHEKKFRQLLMAWAIGFLGYFHLVRKLVRFLDLHFSPRGLFEPLIDEYKPDCIFVTDVFNENDVSLMQAGKRKGITTVGFVRSWDNPSKYLLRVFPDRLLTGSQTLAEEVAYFHQYPEKNIEAVGNPHYDRYKKGPTEDRATFFNHFSFDPNKQMILFSPVGDDLIAFNDFDEYIMRLLAKEGRQVLVRFPPASAVRMTDFTAPPHMYIDIPGKAFSSSVFTDREITPEQDASLVNSLYHADLVITGPTSIPLDSAFFDKPTIVADFYPTKRHPYDGIYEYEYFHFKKLMRETGGVAHIQNESDFAPTIAKLLEEPSLMHEGREKIRSLWFSHDDGKAGERLASKILSFL